jgi:hypothetical protein
VFHIYYNLWYHLGVIVRYFVRTLFAITSKYNKLLIKMQNLTNKVPESSEAPTLRAIYNRFGPRNGLAARVVEHLAAVGTKVSLSTVFNVIYGRSHRAVIIEAFLTVAAAEKERRADLDARTRALVK